MSSFIGYLKSKVFLINLLLALLFVAGVFIATYKYLDAYTNHGESITVPDLRGLTKEEVDDFLKGKNLRYAIMDSSVFDLNKPKGTVIEQEPSPDSKVKENRTIYISVTKTIAPKIKLPNLIDVSYRQAEAILRTYGLKVGELIYKPDLARNAVLAVMMKGKEMKAGDEVIKGSVIDLILGDGFGNTKINVPNLIGLTLEEAMFVIKASALNVGELNFERNVKDTSMAIVYQQYPAPSSGTINQGEAVDLYLSKEKK